MSYNNQNQPPDHEEVNPIAAHIAPNVVDPPDVNAVKDNEAAVNPQYVPAPPTGETKPKGDGFWRGCCAGWCCYCCLDMCFEH